MTGAAQSWSHFRHNYMDHDILIHDNSEAALAERAAMHTGRTEAWRWGKIEREKMYEYDWANSYPRIARDNELPYAFAGTVTAPSIDRLASLWAKYSVLAEVEVSADEACVPASHGERTIWPVGKFRTVLWDPELRLLQESKSIVRVLRAWLYKRAPILKRWAEWVLSSLHDTSGIVESWQKLILKHWSRSLIGRFGMRYRAWERFATTSKSRIYTSEMYLPETGTKTEIMQVGTSVFVLGEMQEVNDGCPQITGWIMSEARAKLWRASREIGQENVYYMDTDSLVVNQKGHRAIGLHYQSGDFAGLRSKAIYFSAHIYGPRSAIFGSKPSVAGMPRGSVKIGPHKYQGEVWRGAGESIRRGEHDSVTIHHRNYELRYNMHRRYFRDNGFTSPYVLPAYEPQCGSNPPSIPFDRLVLNGYPSLLAHSKTTGNLPRPVKRE